MALSRIFQACLCSSHLLLQSGGSRGGRSLPAFRPQFLRSLPIWSPQNLNETTLYNLSRRFGVHGWLNLTSATRCQLGHQGISPLLFERLPQRSPRHKPETACVPHILKASPRPEVPPDDRRGRSGPASGSHTFR
jgi:hypothetical protein